MNRHSLIKIAKAKDVYAAGAGALLGGGGAALLGKLIHGDNYGIGKGLAYGLGGAALGGGAGYGIGTMMDDGSVWDGRPGTRIAADAAGAGIGGFLGWRYADPIANTAVKGWGGIKSLGGKLRGLFKREGNGAAPASETGEAPGVQLGWKGKAGVSALTALLGGILADRGTYYVAKGLN